MAASVEEREFASAVGVDAGVVGAVVVAAEVDVAGEEVGASGVVASG